MGTRLSGKVALVTGAAQGLGEAQARLFAREGATVVVTDIDAEGGRDIAAAIGGSAVFHRLDVTDQEQWATVVEQSVAAFGGVDVLVNNAGTSRAPTRIEHESPDVHDMLLDLNIGGVWHGIRAVVPTMTNRGGGSIVNISSIDGVVGVAGMATYTATKFAVTGLTRAVALELGGRGIRVNSVHPGIMATPLVTRAAPHVQEALQELLSRQPIQRIGRPYEAAQAVLFLASDESSYCTGCALVVDGGHTAGPYRPGYGAEQ